MSGLVKVPKASEVTTMLTNWGDDGKVIFGRLGSGLEPSDFDVQPPTRQWGDDKSWINMPEGELGDELDMLAGGGFEDEPNDMFDASETFPMFNHALMISTAEEPAPKAVRVDTPKSYEGLIADSTVKEIDRRLNELRDAMEQHESDGHGAPVKGMRKWEVLGAIDTVKTLSAATSADDAADSLPQVPLGLPDDMKDSVKCWLDGDTVVLSIRFLSGMGDPRVATMAARPNVDSDEVMGWAMRKGMNPVTVLGVLPQLASIATGKRLMKDVAGAALGVQRRVDVCGMDDEPLVFTKMNGGASATPGGAPLKALTLVQQAANAGNKQAQKEMGLIRAAAQTRMGKQIAAPMLAAVDRQLGGRR